VLAVSESKVLLIGCNKLAASIILYTAALTHIIMPKAIELVILRVIRLIVVDFVGRKLENSPSRYILAIRKSETL
jgi:hypothetical protein